MNADMNVTRRRSVTVLGIRLVVVHGATVWKYTGLPRYEPASMRWVSDGRPGIGPVHATRVSAYIVGVHSGAAGVYERISSPAASKSGFQFALWAVHPGSSCGGIAAM